MILADLLKKMDYEIISGSEDVEISTLVYDSRKVEKDSVFICVTGAVRKAHEFILSLINISEPTRPERVSYAVYYLQKT